MKHLSYFFCAILVICLVACGGKKETGNNTEVSVEKSDVIVEQADEKASDDLDIASTGDDEDVASNELSESEISSDDDNNADSEESAGLSTGSEELDNLLNEYKSNVNRYLDLAKKAAKGDLKALSEYKKLWKETKKLKAQLSEAKSELSATQLEQFNEISKTLLEMASESD